MSARWAPPPEWAEELRREVAALLGAEPRLLFWRELPDERYSSGFTQLHIAYVRAGTEERDQKLVVLHELAHAHGPVREGHSRAYWERAFTLYQHFGLAEYAVSREWHYMATAVRVAHKRGLITDERRDEYLLCHRWAGAIRPKSSASAGWAILRTAKEGGGWWGDYPTARARMERQHAEAMQVHRRRRADLPPKCPRCGKRIDQSDPWGQQQHDDWCKEV